jgi:hypothetical protein
MGPYLLVKKALPDDSGLPKNNLSTIPSPLVGEGRVRGSKNGVNFPVGPTGEPEDRVAAAYGK